MPYLPSENLPCGGVCTELRKGGQKGTYGTSMTLAELPRNGILQGFGAMSLTPGFYGSGQDLVESEKVLRAALDSGITLINTADFYTGVAEGEDVSLHSDGPFGCMLLIMLYLVTTRPPSFVE